MHTPAIFFAIIPLLYIYILYIYFIIYCIYIYILYILYIYSTYLFYIAECDTTEYFFHLSNFLNEILINAFSYYSIYIVVKTRNIHKK